MTDAENTAQNVAQTGQDAAKTQTAQEKEVYISFNARIFKLNYSNLILVPIRAIRNYPLLRKATFEVRLKIPPEVVEDAKKCRLI